MSLDFSASQTEKSAVVGTFPLSLAQSQICRRGLSHPLTAQQVIVAQWDVAGAVTAADLQAALQTVVDRHEILRTRFVMGGDQPRQEVIGSVVAKVEHADFQSIAKTALPKRLDSLAHDMADRLFALDEAGLFRATFAQLAPEQGRLVLVIHQACCDRASLDVMGQEIDAALQNNTAQLPALSLQYGDFTLWQRDTLTPEVLEDHATYWATQLKGAEPCVVMPDPPRPVVKATAVAQVSQTLDADFGANLNALARQLGVTKTVCAAAIFGAALGRLTETDDVLFSTEVSNRIDPVLDPLVGPFGTSLPMRLEQDPAATFADQIAAARPVIEGALSHRNVPEDLLVTAEDGPLATVAFEVSLIEPAQKAPMPGLLTARPAPILTAPHQLSCRLVEHAEHWQVILCYAPARFAAQTAEGFLTLLVDAFATGTQTPSATVAQLAMPECLQDRKSEKDPMPQQWRKPEPQEEEAIATTPEPAPKPTLTTDWRVSTHAADGAGQPLIVLDDEAHAALLGAALDRPVSSMRIADGDRGVALTDQSFMAIAEHYATALRDNRLEEPFLFYGNGVYGCLALEVARQLKRDHGATVTGVVMCDVVEPRYASQLQSRRLMRWRLGLSKKTSRKTRLTQQDTLTKAEGAQAAFAAHLLAQRDIFRPEPVDMPVLLVKTPLAPRARGVLPALGWEHIVGPDLLSVSQHSKRDIGRSGSAHLTKLDQDITDFVNKHAAS